MGLDMFASSVDAALVGDQQVDFVVPEGRSTEIAYWRKHHELHQQMAIIYRAKGGTDRDFNCASVRLDASDIDTLESWIRERWGEESHEDDPSWTEEDRRFVSAARQAISDGKVVYYSAWY